MNTSSALTQVDPEKLMEFVLRAVEEAGAALNCALVVMGDRLGYYWSLVEHGPSTPAELAERTGTDEHYAREWLNAQTAGAFVDYDPTTGRYRIPPEQAVALTDETSPAFVGGLFQIAHGTASDAGRIIEAARAGAGVAWGDHNFDVHVGCERFFRPTYAAHLVADWLPALDGVVEKLVRAARVADVGCGHGASTLLMGEAFPASTFVGVDGHAQSIEVARERNGTPGTVSFQTATADAFGGGPYDLVTMFDCLHDMGDPIGAARHIREVIADDGTWMVVEPAAGDRVEDNLNPIGRAYYGFSTLLCTPSSMAQPVGMALGTQAGPARIRDVVTEAGFRRFRLAAQTPFNNVFEVRP
ncbi:SAM-dependent methyltransferase [Mycolicibacterium novocastrense]|uniref:class I SAM-dependent methyltransferase n=1 Tax=Mycolicibacterium novocastrense TaxID=59813 RepID=UPI000746792A|nr:class I SAM-dependent methyltransferase [Mycolicibacterium novocastrense]KUH68278.1 SAM-dependent methyltransferase [Mycolicibacterium novocastrense]KUH68786.1 SAM-dependent methyltransferase [Mycolicibacterium novocastrense]KUH69423.1 SAM-dependent methyltransferase [Mycolicibacterium novocastrense]